VLHQKHAENFFNLKGRFQLWAQKGTGEQQARLLTQASLLLPCALLRPELEPTLEVEEILSVLLVDV
jgi:hypothetical protein